MRIIGRNEDCTHLHQVAFNDTQLTAVPRHKVVDDPHVEGWLTVAVRGTGV